MTSDGISSEDGEVVRELAVEIVNAGTDGQRAIARSRLLEWLDRLESKYGTLPSILATRADFIDDVTIKLSLLNDAYCLAEFRNDRKNALEVSHSLAELYVEDCDDLVNGRKWLDRLQVHLADTPDDYRQVDFDRLVKKIESNPD